jgi:hypothetical protein
MVISHQFTNQMSSGCILPQTLANERWRPVAYKEWQLIAEALGRGEQSLLLRKGGISEGKVGFQWLHREFFLFPSLFHEQAEQVLPGADGQARSFDSPADPEGLVSFRFYAEIQDCGRITNWEEVTKLSPFHIWTEEIVKERFVWGDEPGLSWATVRVWRLAQPWILEDRATFGGCRSWFGLPADEAGGWRKALEGAELVPLSCGKPEWLIGEAAI